jgi:hypothetical protein
MVLRLRYLPRPALLSRQFPARRLRTVSLLQNPMRIYHILFLATQKANKRSLHDSRRVTETDYLLSYRGASTPLSKGHGAIRWATMRRKTTPR